jgi:DNA-binding NarL/FixJ family response regulator
MTTIRVAIVEDDDVTRDCLRETLEGEDGFDVVGVAANGSETREVAFGSSADVIVVDLGLGDESGVDIIRELRERVPNAEIMAHTVFEDRDSVFRALEAGATSYLLKGASTAELTAALREVREGGAPMSPKIARMVIQKLHTSTEPDPITPRERQILRAVDEGLTYKEIAAKLAISVHTVHSHIKTVYERLHASGKREALAAARKRGLI